MALGNPYELESEVVKMLIRRDVVSLQCAYGIIKLDVPESKKGKQHFLFYNLISVQRKVKPKKMVAFKFLKNFTDSLVNISKCQTQSQ